MTKGAFVPDDLDVQEGLSRLEAALSRLEAAAATQPSESRPASETEAELSLLRQKHERLFSETELAIEELDRLVAAADAA